MMNPYTNGAAWEVVEKFYLKYYNDDRPRAFIFGINPGRHGAGVTGIPFTDPIRLAEKCGIAFQLTNIIRDVKEDAEMGRVYLPAEDLAKFGISAVELASATNAPRLRPLLAMEAERAREYYRAGEQLIPYIDEDSQPALWVLITIYKRLLEKIAARDFDVFHDKIRLRTSEKLAILGKGFLKRLA